MFSGASYPHHYTNGAVVLSEIGSVQLEFRYLSYHTGDDKYAIAANKVIKFGF